MHSLKFKIISILLTSMSVLLACQAFFIGPHIKNKHIEESLNMQMALSDYIAEEFDHSFRQAITELEQMAQLPEIRSSDKVKNDQLISTMNRVTPFFNYFFLMDRTGTWLSYPKRPHLVGKSIPEQNLGWVNQTFKDNRTTSLDVVLATQIGKLVSGFSTPIPPESGEPDKLLRGVFVVSEDNLLLATLKKMKVGANGYAFLVAENGWVLAHPHLKQSPDKFTVYDYNEFPPVRAVTTGKAGHAEYEYDNKKWLACYRPIKSTGWGIVVQQPLEDIYGPIEKDMLLIIWFFIVSLVLCTLALVFSVRHTLNPLTELAQVIAAGNPMKSALQFGEDEVGQLASRFSDLFTKLRESLAARENSEVELVAYKESLEDQVKERTSELRTEIDDRKMVEKALRASEEKLSLLIAQSPLGIISWDLDFQVDSWNPAAEKIFGFPAEDALGKPAEIIIPQDARKDVDKIWQELVSMTGGTQSRNKNVTRDGRTILCEWYNTPVVDQAGKVLGVLSLVEDVTQQARMEKDLLKARKLESLGILAGGIAHDFNNLLAGILGNINLSLFDESLGDKTRTRLVRAEKATLQAANLTQQLLTFAKGGEPVKEVAPLADIIMDSANFVLHGDTVSCRFTIPEDLWFVDVDKGQISQVIQNIVLNASHSMPGGGIINIACENTTGLVSKNQSMSQDGKFVKMTIADEGVGIPDKVIDRIFDPYFSTKQEGSGLGLAITHSIVTKHGGHLSVESEAGVGTTFTVYLPATDRQMKQSPVAEALGPQTRKAKIMVMDDDESILDVTEAMLEEIGHQTVLAQDGAEAVRLYKKAADSAEPVDLVIMDLTVPGGMGGEEAVRKILAFAPEAKVIVSSGYSNDVIMASYKQYGFCGAVSKPYKLHELSMLIEAVLHESDN